MTSRSLPLTVALLAVPIIGTPVTAQSLSESARLVGIEQVDVRAEVSWDEAITVSAGGATSDQFLEALEQGFEKAILESDDAPDVLEGAPVTVTCHVDTYYETGLIVYSLRSQVETSGQDGAPVIVWIDSAVGSFTVQQLHLMFTLGRQCAERFTDAWASAN